MLLRGAATRAAVSLPAPALPSGDARHVTLSLQRLMPLSPLADVSFIFDYAILTLRFRHGALHYADTLLPITPCRRCRHSRCFAAAMLLMIC